tara:strand:- start:227 stop:1447 length:1221 start_codon:yes stop_codon:yes gene_type:complete
MNSNLLGTTDTKELDRFQNAIHQTVGNRTLIHKKANFNDRSAMHLEQVRDYLRKLKSKQAPFDVPYSYGGTFSAFNVRGVPHLQFIKKDGKRSETCRFTRQGWLTFLRELLPAHGRNTIEALANMGDSGAQLATLAMNKFAHSSSKADLKRFFRMVMTRCPEDEKQIIRVVRSVHGTGRSGYSPVDNLPLVEQLLVDSDLEKCRVLDFCVQDDQFRLRFALTPIEEMVETNKLYPMMELRNSETGRGAVKLFGGGLRIVCHNGITSYQSDQYFSWAHRGNYERIVEGVAAGVEDIQRVANGVTEKYNKALDIEINNMMDFLYAEMKGMKATETEIENVIKRGLSDETTTKGNNLAAAVDGITLIAQESDLMRQLELEHMAESLMTRGIDSSIDNRIYVRPRTPVEA